MRSERIIFLIFLFQVFYLTTFSQNHSFTYTTPICYGSFNPAPITSTNFATGGTFLSSPGLIINGNTGVITVSLSTPGTYTVTYTGSICMCFTNAPVFATVTINPALPPFSITGFSMCSYPGITQYTLSANPLIGLSYTWQPFGTLGNTLLLPISQTNVTLALVGGINGCTAVATATTSTIAPIPVFIAGPTVVCEGSPVTLTASGASSYSWNTGATTPVITNTPAFSTNYVIVTNDVNGCLVGASHTVMVVPIPTVAIVANPTLCTGYAFTLSAVGANSYTWSVGTVTNGIAVIPTASVTTYSVVGSVLGCTNSAMHTVSLVPLPTVSIVGTNTICQGSSFTLTAMGAPSYTWSTGSQLYFITGSPLVNTTYSVQGKETNGCINQAVVTVTVYPKPTITVLGSNTVCVGTTTTYTATGAVTNFSWSTGIVSNTLSLFADTDSTFTYIVRGSNAFGCEDTQTLTVKAFPTPTVSLNSDSICSGKSTTLEAVTSGSAGLTYQWFPIGGFSSSVSVAPPATTVYTVIVKLGQCPATAVSTVFVTQTLLPVTGFFYNNPFCSGPEPAVPAYLPGFTQGGTFSSSQGISVDPGNGRVDLSSIETGFYGITYSVAASGCTLSNSGYASLQVNKSVTISMTPSVEILPGESYTLTNSGGVDSYIWSPAFGLNCAICATPVATPAHTTKYCVTSSQPCVVGTCILVEVLCVVKGDLSLPNAFSPNGDRKNDQFCLKGWAECCNSFNIIIFDRWGRSVFESQNPNFCWDGASAGELLPSGVYMYVINAQFGKDPAMKKSGNISLIR